jgi:hypothetical protein
MYIYYYGFDGLAMQLVFKRYLTIHPMIRSFINWLKGDTHNRIFDARNFAIGWGTGAPSHLRIELRSSGIEKLVQRVIFGNSQRAVQLLHWKRTALLRGSLSVEGRPIACRPVLIY